MRVLLSPIFFQMLTAIKLPVGHYLGQGITARLGVRYAEPPKRFQPAEMARNWYDSAMDKASKACPQAKGFLGFLRQLLVLVFPGLETSEDCLFINVFGPLLPERALPVIVYIHGGAYKLGNANEFKLENLGNLSRKQDVILVTIQYRLSVLGFFNPHLPFSKHHLFTLNLGLNDTHLALQFINQNIKYFGGDPTQVTLLGHSAGACSAHALAISPAVDSRLFKRIILMSGVVEICFNGTGSLVNPSALAAAEICNFKMYDPYYDRFEKNLYECLANASLDALEGIDLKHERNWMLYNDGYFFPKSGYHTMSRSKLAMNSGHDVLIGATTGEWAFFENLFAKYLGRTDYSRNRFHQTLMKYAGVKLGVLESLALEDFYTINYNPKLYLPPMSTNLANGSMVSTEERFWFECVVNSMTDFIFHGPIVSEVKKLRSAEVSLFLYTYNSTHASPSWNKVKHASHSDELPGLFGEKFDVFGSTMFFFAKNGYLGDEKTGLIRRDGNNSLHHVVFEPDYWYMENPQGFDGFCPRARDLMLFMKNLPVVRD